MQNIFIFFGAGKLPTLLSSYSRYFRISGLVWGWTVQPLDHLQGLYVPPQWESAQELRAPFAQPRLQCLVYLSRWPLAGHCRRGPMNYRKLDRDQAAHGSKGLRTERSDATRGSWPLLGSRTLLGTKGIATGSKDASRAPGLTTRSKDATNGARSDQVSDSPEQSMRNVVGRMGIGSGKRFKRVDTSGKARRCS